MTQPFPQRSNEKETPPNAAVNVPLALVRTVRAKLPLATIVTRTRSRRLKPEPRTVSGFPRTSSSVGFDAPPDAVLVSAKAAISAPIRANRPTRPVCTSGCRRAYRVIYLAPSDSAPTGEQSKERGEGEAIRRVCDRRGGRARAACAERWCRRSDHRAVR